jgi:uncharacterized membrane protein
VPVILRCEPEEVCRRVTSPERATRFKERSADKTRENIRTYQLLRVDHPNCLELEITTLSPIQAAQAILAHVEIRISMESERITHVSHSTLKRLGRNRRTMMNWMMNGGMAFMGGMALFMTVWILLLVVLIWALIRWLSGRSVSPAMPPPGRPSALEVLEQRYARGEIDHATFLPNARAGATPLIRPTQHPGLSPRRKEGLVCDV